MASTKPPFCIWVDADSCPKLIKDIIIRCSIRLNVPCTFVANKPVAMQKTPLCTMVLVDAKKDAADNYILQNTLECDLVITRDLLFAKKLLQKGVSCINDRGLVFDKNNIDTLLQERAYNLRMATLGFGKKGIPCFSKKQVQLFADCLDRLTTKKIKKLQ